MRKRISLLIHCVAVLLLLAACGGGNTRTVTDAGETIELRHARLLKMSEHEGYTYVEVINPWDTTRVYAKYALVPRGGENSVALGDDIKRIPVPVERSVVYSAVHSSLLAELGRADAVTGVCDVEYVYNKEILDRLAEGETKVCGTNTNPNVEQMVLLKPDMILLSPYEEYGGDARLTATGIPLVQAADYMERTPLGRAEWMRFYGRLIGRGAEADSLFDATEREYNRLATLAKGASTHPRVLFDRCYGNVWSVPTAGSVMGRMIVDAGGTNPFADLDVSGSAQLAPERVLYQGGDADIWLVRYRQPKPLTLAEIAGDNKMYTKVKAFGTGRVYGSNTGTSRIFEDGAFHPQRVLADMIRILHPGIIADAYPRYYHKLK